MLGLIIQLDNGPDLVNNHDSAVIEGKLTSWQQWYQLTIRNYKIYKAESNAAIMELYRNHLKHGLYNDGLARFLMQIAAAPNARIGTDTDSSLILGFSEKKEFHDGLLKANEFLKAFNEFYVLTSFNKYMTEHKRIYSKIITEVNTIKPGGVLITTMEDFYQQKFNRYYLVPSYNMLPTTGFGIADNRSNNIYNIFGPFSFQHFGDNTLVTGFNFKDKLAGLSIHEFGHSFVNPILEEVPDSIKKMTNHLFEPIRELMQQQAYPTWNICLNEHFVRAGEIIIARKMGKYSEAADGLASNIKKGFRYLPFIVEELERYNIAGKRRQKYSEQVLQILLAMSSNNFSTKRATYSQGI